MISHNCGCYWQNLVQKHNESYSNYSRGGGGWVGARDTTTTFCLNCQEMVEFSIFSKTCKKLQQKTVESRAGGCRWEVVGGPWKGGGGNNCGVTNKYWAPAPHPHTPPALSFINSRPKNRLITMDLRNIIHNGGNVVTNYF